MTATATATATKGPASTLVPTSRLEWLSNMPVYDEPEAFRKTSIICTIGPKTNSVPMIQALRRAGMNIVRLNFSHGSHEYHASVIKNTRDSFKDCPGRMVAIALDTKGPEIRTGRMKGDAEITIPQDHVMTLSTNDANKDSGDIDMVYIDYKKLPTSTEPGRNIYVDDGQLRFEVLECGADYVKVKALNEWKISNNKGVNLPMTTVELPALSERDKGDIRFAVEQGLDMIFASFIRKRQDILDIRETLGPRGAAIKIIAKIESHEGLNNFADILEEADGIMVARGDLGIEIPVEKVFIAQKMMIARCNSAGKPIICATQMLETMTYNPRPTRAEVSDVANAVLDGADCVMLSGETAKGSYPIEAVSMMHKLCREAEGSIFYPPLFNELRAITLKPTSVTEAIASSAINASLEQNAAAIIVLTTSGNSARLLAKYRPRVPIITVSRNAQVARQSHLNRGCYPFYYEKPFKAAGGAGGGSGTATPLMESPTSTLDIWQEDVDSRVEWAIEQGKLAGMLKVGDHVIAVQGWKGGSGHTSVMRLLPVTK